MKKSKLIKEIDNRIYFLIFVALLWSKEILLAYCRGAVLKIPVLSAGADYFIPALMFLMFLLSYRTIAERLRGADFVFIMVCLVVYVGEYVIFKRNRAYFERNHLNFFVGCLPLYFVGVALQGDDEEGIIRLLFRISCVSVVAFGVYTMLIKQMDSDIVRKGNMDSAYDLLPHACLVFYFTVKEFKWWKLLIVILAGISILMMGTRGAVLCFLVFILAVCALTIKFKRPVTIFILAGSCLIFFVFRGLTDRLIEAAYSIGRTLGLSTRVFDKLMSGDFTVSVARDSLKAIIRYYLRAYPVTGLGIYGDCYVTQGQYAHNLFVEIYAHFGYVMGTVITVALAILAFRGTRIVLKSRNDNSVVITLLLLCCCFKLAVSSSYLRESFFWLMLGYFAATIRSDRLAGGSKHVALKNSRFIK